MSSWEVRANEPFADPTRLTKWTVWSLLTLAGITAVSLVSDIVERNLLLSLQAQGFVTPNEVEAATSGNDLRQGIIGLSSFAINLVAIILSGRWIYRANLNVWRLGAEGLYAPVWAVGYYFVPLLNLWKPYQAMREIWRASANPKHWESVTTPSLFPLWWALWLISCWLGSAMFRLALRAENTTELLIVNELSIVINLVDLPLAFVFIALIRQIYRMQMEQSAGMAAPDMRSSAMVSA